MTVSYFSHAIGRIYVDKHINDETRTEIKQMVRELKTAFGQLIDVNDWMDNTTTAKAKEKVCAIIRK